jgi:short subunit dehydrogenase-like uncharacterized protein
MEQRPYDIVLFGATGFTGGLVAEYLAKHEESFRWAIAGRNLDKLRQVHADLKLNADVDIISADIQDPGSLEAMARQARVVLSTVGPYVRYGEPLVKACIESGADYADITGEPAFVNQMIERYHKQALERHLRIVNCCGFDSIPHDLGVYMVVKKLPEDQPVQVEGIVSASGAISGGTWHSAIEAMGNMRKQGPARAWPPIVGDRRVRSGQRKVHYKEAVDGWVVPFPTIDPQVILRSARALPLYGQDFEYAHYLRVGSLPALAGMAVGLGSVAALAQIKPTRDLLLKLRSPGEGPSEAQRARNHFQVTLIGRSGNQRVVGEVRGGDPGYGETSKMAAESALCLALDRDQLSQHYGVITTAMAMADPLLVRLRRAGLKFEV